MTLPYQQLKENQQELVKAPLGGASFLEGPAGAGKTTAAVARLLTILESGVQGEQVLLLFPQRTLAEPYLEALSSPIASAGGVVSAVTVGGLARRLLDIFWPLVAEKAGFAKPESLPNFLTIETAQYYMAFLVRPMIEEHGLFDSLVIDRNRLYSQILDNLNKAALVGFPHGEIGDRLASSWVGEPAQLRIYQDAQTCASEFRKFCLQNNLLDFSLQLEIFSKLLWHDPIVRSYLENSYRHLIYDNIEEDSPVAHDLLLEWLPEFESALLIYDWQGGYRSFLGADAISGYGLKEACEQELIFEDSLVISPQVYALGDSLGRALRRDQDALEGSPLSLQTDDYVADPIAALEFTYQRFYPQMLDWVAERIAELVHDEGLPPGEIAILAPFMNDALRFSLSERLQSYDIPWRSHRPSRALRDEPAARCLVTLALLAHPEWGLHPQPSDVAYALMQSIDGLDLVRAQLLTQVVYRMRGDGFGLSSFDAIRTPMQERITYSFGERFEGLRLWLLRSSSMDPKLELDHFFSHIFGEVLSQPGFGFHADYDAGQVTANLIESVGKFRWVVGQTLTKYHRPLGQEYLVMLGEGVLAAQYLGGWRSAPHEAVLLAPAYTFLMSNRPVTVQFWLGAGGSGWSERLFQPLTHPYVLSRNWPGTRPWSDADELETSRHALFRLCIGLLRRCREKVFLGLSELGESGYEQRGPLLQAFQRVLRERESS